VILNLESKFIVRVFCNLERGIKNEKNAIKEKEGSDFKFGKQVYCRSIL